jgi:endonuclease YncB( thermonuclease family)
MKTRLAIVIATLTLLLLPLASLNGKTDRGTDCSADIDVVKDGDTFTIANPTISEFVTQEDGVIEIEDGMEVRLADINCPEVRGWIKLEELEGALEAWWFVYDNFDGETVDLDIDDIHGVDKYGRLVCVVYWGGININKLLVDKEYAHVDDHDNEFDPNDWWNADFQER